MGIGISEKGGHAIFYVLVDSTGPSADIPPRIEGVEVRVGRRSPVRLHDCPGGPPCHSDQLSPPIEMGNSAGREIDGPPCTLGFKACDLDSGEMVYVTASHCNDNPMCNLTTTLDTQHVAPQDEMGSPALIIGDIEGPASHAAPACDASADNFTDATKVTSPNSLTSVAHRDLGVPPPGALVFPMPGDIVRLSGRTSGLTFGSISAVNFTIEVPAGPDSYCCGPLTMHDQLAISWIADTADGDSGAGVLRYDEDNAFTHNRVVGLHWGADDVWAYANRIDRIIQALNVTLDFSASGCQLPF